MIITVRTGLEALLDTLADAADQLEGYGNGTFAVAVRQAGALLHGVSQEPMAEEDPPTIIDRIADAIAMAPVPQLRKREAGGCTCWELGYETTVGETFVSTWRLLERFEDSEEGSGEGSDAMERTNWMLKAVAALNVIYRAIDLDEEVSIPLAGDAGDLVLIEKPLQPEELGAPA
jgi:hypothetical protein